MLSNIILDQKNNDSILEYLLLKFYQKVLIPCGVSDRRFKNRQ